MNMHKIHNLLNNDDDDDDNLTLKTSATVSEIEIKYAKNEMPKIHKTDEVLTELTAVNESASPLQNLLATHSFSSSSSSISITDMDLNLCSQTADYFCGNYKINPKLLVGRKFVKLSIRRRTRSQSNNQSESSKLLHTKYLESRLIVNLTYANNLTILYNRILLYAIRKDIISIYHNSTKIHEILAPSIIETLHSDDLYQTKAVMIVDKNLIKSSTHFRKLPKYGTKKMDGESNSITSGQIKKDKAPSTISTFNSMDEAVKSAFGLNQYTLIRITRSTTDDTDGSVILKIETATPGDKRLIDDPEFADEMLQSFGEIDSRPLSVFVKKIVARPRYKSNMKIFLVPGCMNFALYTDQRMFERDLINGVIHIDFEPKYLYGPENLLTNDLKLNKPHTAKEIFVTFPVSSSIKDYLQLVRMSLNEKAS